MRFHRNTPARLAASLAALAAVIISFKVLPKDQAESVIGLVAVIGTMWHPRHEPRTRTPRRRR